MLEIELFWHENCVLMLNWIIGNKTIFTYNSVNCPVCWGCRIHRLHLCNECPRYNTKNSDSGVPTMLELWGMRSAPSLPLLSGPLWPGKVAPNKLNITNSIFMLNWIVWIWTVWLKWIAWNRNIFDNQIVLTFKLCAYAKLNCLKWNCFWHWNCIYTKLICLI